MERSLCAYTQTHIYIYREREELKQTITKMNEHTQKKEQMEEENRKRVVITVTRLSTTLP